MLINDAVGVPYALVRGGVSAGDVRCHSIIQIALALKSNLARVFGQGNKDYAYGTCSRLTRSLPLSCLTRENCRQ